MAAGPERPVAEAQRQDREQPPPENGFMPLEQTQAPRLLPHVDVSVLPSLGGFGKHQKQLVVLTWIPALFIGFSQFSDYFLLAQPKGTCVQPLVNGSNWTVGSLKLPVTATNGDIGKPVPYSGGMECECKEWKLELQTGLSQNVVTKWNLVCDSAWKVHIAKFSFLVGSIFGYLVMGVVADWFGRQPVLIVSVLFMLVFGLSVAFSFNVTMFSTLRFFEGFCLAGLTLSLYVLRIELCLPGWRFSMTMVASFLMVGGQLVMPGVAALCRDWPVQDDWQVLQIMIICPFILMLPYVWIFPESLRWLLATQHYRCSKAMMLRIARKNQVDMTTEPSGILAELENELHKKPKRTCIIKMTSTRNFWKNIVVLCVNSLTGYGIHHCFARSMMDPEAPVSAMFNADYYTMAGIAVATCLALCPAVAFMGRRGGLLTFMIITALASLLQLGLLNLIGKYSLRHDTVLRDTLNRKFSVAFSIIGMFSSHAVSTLSIFFCAEITPTIIRGGGLGLVLASAGFGMLTAPIMELHNQKGYFLHHMIFAACTLLCIICLLLLPEPRNQPLPESLVDGEIYTRQPLLTHRPGEQHLLLTKPGDRDLYSRVHDTPLRLTATGGATAAAATALAAVPTSYAYATGGEVISNSMVVNGVGGSL
ncbi:solute carrier family 22 member 23 isoform X1 [Salmo salar]|uniref:Solute carrier family 22 member 23 isoform X1 n=1 Tax=Salmo salar TaxID=8030 RepID=A0A1S3PA09_SALSA|nr:solute carrier family 22 member 23 isoform X1 [Salmo salar]|eukprot:XP_014024389.1 PREDICTED: solute carrier family 22 member 23-like isoform X1 [Salmo salar]